MTLAKSGYSATSTSPVPGALVMVLEERAAVPGEAALLAETAIAVDWLRPEEDAAWSHLLCPAQENQSV